jgi:ubiquinol oxidase
MVAGMIHHLRSLRTVQHDNWIRTLLDEAENERIHLFCWLDVLKPTWTQRLLIVTVQGIFFTGFLSAYILFPKSCHRFVGYLEEEAFKTYTKLLQHIDEGKIKDRPAPQLAIEYWNMPAGSTMRDMTVIIREDENDHARVNHSMANMITKLRKRDMVYDDISIDDSVFETLPGTKIVEHGQVEAISLKPKADL